MITDNVIRFPVIPRLVPKSEPSPSLMQRLLKSTESKARVQAMTDQIKEANRQQDIEEEVAYEKKRQKTLLLGQARALVRIGGKQWAEELLNQAIEEVRSSQDWRE